MTRCIYKQVIYYKLFIQYTCQSYYSGGSQSQIINFSFFVVVNIMLVMAVMKANHNSPGRGRWSGPITNNTILIYQINIVHIDIICKGMHFEHSEFILKSFWVLDSNQIIRLLLMLQIYPLILRRYNCPGAVNSLDMSP